MQIIPEPVGLTLLAMRRSIRARRFLRKDAEAPKAPAGTAATALRGNPTSRYVQPIISTMARLSQSRIRGTEDDDGNPKKPVMIAGNSVRVRGTFGFDAESLIVSAL